jgi:mRNA-degrading endonuclease toxin of MazEF toxin-antitoxin module
VEEVLGELTKIRPAGARTRPAIAPISVVLPATTDARAAPLADALGLGAYGGGDGSSYMAGDGWRDRDLRSFRVVARRLRPPA